jgi:hypothetical protein
VDCFEGAAIRPPGANRTFDSAAVADMRALLAEVGDDEFSGVPGALISHRTAAMRLEWFDKGLAASSPRIACSAEAGCHRPLPERPGHAPKSAIRCR